MTTSPGLAELGRRVVANERTLSRLFRDEVGMGYTVWRKNLRASAYAGRYVVRRLFVSGNSRSVAATALTATGSSVQGRPVRVEAWKFVTRESLAASVSSAHATRSSSKSSGDMGASGT